MESLSIRQALIHQLLQLTPKHKSLSAPNTTNVDWKSLKADIQKDLNKLKENARIFEIIACICVTITVAAVLVNKFSDNRWPDLNKGELFIFLTVTNLVSAFRQSLRIEKLEKQRLLLSILEVTDVEKQTVMQTSSIRQGLIDQLAQLTPKHKFFSGPNTTNVVWASFKVDIQKDLDKLRKNAMPFEILAYIYITITGVLLLIKWFGNNYGPDLNKGASLIFLIIVFTISAFKEKLQVEKLEKKILLLNILEKTNVEKEVNVPEYIKSSFFLRIFYNHKWYVTKRM